VVTMISRATTRPFEHGGPIMRLSTAAGTLTIVATLLSMSGKALAQGSTCSSWYDACYQSRSVAWHQPKQSRTATRRFVVVSRQDALLVRTQALRSLAILLSNRRHQPTTIHREALTGCRSAEGRGGCVSREKARDGSSAEVSPFAIPSQVCIRRPTSLSLSDLRRIVGIKPADVGDRAVAGGGKGLVAGALCVAVGQMEAGAVGSAGLLQLRGAWLA